MHLGCGRMGMGRRCVWEALLVRQWAGRWQRAPPCVNAAG